MISPVTCHLNDWVHSSFRYYAGCYHRCVEFGCVTKVRRSLLPGAAGSSEALVGLVRVLEGSYETRQRVDQLGTGALLYGGHLLGMRGGGGGGGGMGTQGGGTGALRSPAPAPRTRSR